MDDEIMGRIFAPMMVLLAIAGVGAVLFDWLRSVHCPTLLAIAILLAAAALGLAAVVYACRRWPGSVQEKTAISESFPDPEPLPEFSTGAPAVTIDGEALFFVASRRRRGAAYDTFVAMFDRSTNAWRDEAGTAARPHRADDRWLLHEENRELIHRATQRMGDAFKPLEQGGARAN